MSIFQISGVIGAFLILIAFVLLQREVYKSKDRPYLWINLWGAILIMISFIEEWNTAGFILEIVWIITSLHGLAKRR